MKFRLLSEQADEGEWIAATVGFLRNLPAEGVTPLEPRRLDDVNAPGFLVPGHPTRDGDQVPARVWVHPETRLPLRIETTLPSGSDRSGEATRFFSFVYTDVRFDVPVSPDAFAPEIPVGYELNNEWVAGEKARRLERDLERAEREVDKAKLAAERARRNAEGAADLGRDERDY